MLATAAQSTYWVPTPTGSWHNLISQLATCKQTSSAEVALRLKHTPSDIVKWHCQKQYKHNQSDRLMRLVV